MKNFKKMMALVIAMVMVVGTMSAMVVSAEDTPTPVDRTISVSGLEADDSVTFYKVLSWADDTAEIAALAAENPARPTVSGWYPEKPFDSVLTESVLKAAINAENKLIITDTLAGDIARALNGTGASQATSYSATVTGTSPNATASYTFSQVTGTDTDGLYMAIITPQDQNVVYNPVFVHLDPSSDTDPGYSFAIIESSASYMNTPAGSGAAKKSRISTNKEAHNVEDYTDYQQNPPATGTDDGDTTAPGDHLTMTVTSTIPGYGDMFKKPFFNLSDTMKDLEIWDVNNNSDFTDDITVTLADGTAIPKVNSYPTIENLSSGDGEEGYYIEATAGGYTIKFTPAYLKTINVPTGIKIEYKVTVLEGANTSVIKEKNTVVLDFSHDVDTESDATPGGEKEYQKDITNHYTFSIDANNLVGPYEDRVGESGSELIKIATDKDGNPIMSTVRTSSNITVSHYQASPLGGATFALYKATQQANGSWVANNDVYKTATSDSAGRINFTGLDAGVYFLEETKAPAGYVKQSGKFQITISAELEQREITEYYDQAGNWYAETASDRKPFTYYTDELKSYSITYGNEASSYTFTHAHESRTSDVRWTINDAVETPQSIVNTKGVELPSTGGTGTTLFYAIGAILVLGAGILLVSKRRMSAN